MWYNNMQVKKNKNKSKDNINYTIAFREPEEAENLVSKNNLLSPYLLLNWKCNKFKNSKFNRKSALKINKMLSIKKINN